MSQSKEIIGCFANAAARPTISRALAACTFRRAAPCVAQAPERARTRGPAAARAPPAAATPAMATAGGDGEEWRGEGRKPRRERERVRVPIAQRHQRSRGGEAQCAQTLFKPCRNGNNTRHDPVGPTAPGRAQGPARHHRPQSRHIDTSRWRILRVAARHGVGLARIVVELAHGTLDAVQFNPVQSSGSHVSEAWVRVRRNSSMEAQAEESRWRQLTCQGFSAMRARQ